MREIKFRVWDINRKRMLDSQDIVFNDGNYYEDYRDFEDGIVLKNIVVMQSTGLKDKNDVEIYEGDLVEHEDDLGDGWKTYEASEIVFDEDYLQYCFRWDTSNFLLNYKNLNVVGNIYENPELLEG